MIEPDNQETEGISSDEFLRRLPCYDKIGKTFETKLGYTTAMYDQMMSHLQLSGDERLLDLGAGRCWTTRDLALRGCKCVAIDIVTMKYIGLESSDVYFEQHPGMYWDRARADMEAIPFIDESFDVIFCCAALHHSSNVETVVDEMGRVLAPGGRIVLVNEPDYGLLDRKQVEERLYEEEASEGVNENLYNHRFFVRLLKRAGFSVESLAPKRVITYRAWMMSELYRKFGMRRGSYRIQKACEAIFRKWPGLIRLFYGLGTMCIATKVEMECRRYGM